MTKRIHEEHIARKGQNSVVHCSLFAKQRKPREGTKVTLRNTWVNTSSHVLREPRKNESKLEIWDSDPIPSESRSWPDDDANFFFFHLSARIRSDEKTCCLVSRHSVSVGQHFRVTLRARGVGDTLKCGPGKKGVQTPNVVLFRESRGTENYVWFRRFWRSVSQRRKPLETESMCKRSCTPSNVDSKCKGSSGQGIKGGHKRDTQNNNKKSPLCCIDGHPPQPNVRVHPGECSKEQSLKCGNNFVLHDFVQIVFFWVSHRRHEDFWGFRTQVVATTGGCTHTLLSHAHFSALCCAAHSAPLMRVHIHAWLKVVKKVCCMRTSHISISPSLSSRFTLHPCCSRTVTSTPPVHILAELYPTQSRCRSAPWFFEDSPSLDDWIFGWRSGLASLILNWCLILILLRRWWVNRFCSSRTPWIQFLRVRCWRGRNWTCKNVSRYSMRVPNAWRPFSAARHSYRTA